MLFDAGYAGINWPKEYGGRGATPTEHLIFLEETERARAPVRRHELRRPAARRPDAHRRGRPTSRRPSTCPASSRASTSGARASPSRTPAPTSPACAPRAVRDGDDYVITGQKIWTSFGHVADYCEMLVRTDPEAPEAPRHHLADRADGHAGHRRPPAAHDGGHAPSSARCSSTRCACPVANRVGDENDGWRVAMVTLSFERGTAFVVRGARVDGARARPRRARQDDHQQRRDRAGRTPASVASSAASPPSSTRCGR